MNIKTTIGLGIAVIVLSAAFLIFGGGQSAPSADGDGSPTTPGQPITGATDAEDDRSLAHPLTDDTTIQKIVYEKRGQPRMVFERTEGDDGGGPVKWQMVEPTRCEATTWTVNDVVLAAKRLKYASKYDIAGENSLSLEDAGIRPEPVARFAVTSVDGDTVEFEVGKLLIGQRKRYVYLPSRPDEVFVAEETFDNILDRDPAQFREGKLFRMIASHAVELEIIERGDDGLTTYKLKKQDGEWAFVAPFSAKAESKKIQDVVNMMNRVRATPWLEEIPTSRAPFGLDPPYLQVTVATEEEVVKPAPEDKPEEDGEEGETTGETTESDEEPEPEIEIKRNEFVLLLSDRRPIDDDKKVYLQRGGEEQVGLINATELDKFVPRLSEWRIMKIFTKGDASRANSLKIQLSEKTLEFELRGNDWFFTGTEQLAEPGEIAAVLAALELLKAVSFTDTGVEPSFGLDTPAAEITLGFPESDEVLTLRIGAFTEQVEKRLRYVQRGGSSTVAKVRNNGLTEIFREQAIYRNRELLDFADSGLLKIELARQLEASGRKQHLTLERDEDGVWQMTAPTQSEVDLEAVQKMANKLAKLRGTRIADEQNPDKLGLSEPDIEVTLTVKGVPTIKVPETGDENTAPEITPGEPITRRLGLSKQDGVVYARSPDVPVFMEVDAAVYDALMAEVIDGVFWDFEMSQVVAFGSKDGEREISLRKVRDRWQYSLEPDIPIDGSKVDQHISKLRHFKTRRYVEYTSANRSAYGLDAPTRQFFFEVEGGTRYELLISGADYRGTGEGLYATTIDSASRIFVLDPMVLKLGVIELSRLEAE